MGVIAGMVVRRMAHPCRSNCLIPLTLTLSRGERGLSGVAGWHGVPLHANVPPLPLGEGRGEGAGNAKASS
ncbi:hypothetical protein D3C76_680210 [compost metagenome]